MGPLDTELATEVCGELVRGDTLICWLSAVTATVEDSADVPAPLDSGDAPLQLTAQNPRHAIVASIFLELIFPPNLTAPRVVMRQCRPTLLPDLRKILAREADSPEGALIGTMGWAYRDQ